MVVTNSSFYTSFKSGDFLFIELFSIFAPVIASIALTGISFGAYYSEAPVFTALLCILSGIVTLLCVLPFKPPYRLFCIFAGTLALSNTLYNLAFSLVVPPVAVIIALFLYRPTAKKRILFTCDNVPVTLRYRPVNPVKGYFALSGTLFLALTVILFAFTLIFSTPCTLWNIRAFPINLSQKAPYEEYAVPSGEVTCTVFYDNAAIYVEDFTPIETEEGIIESPAKAAGMQKGDVILKINGQYAKSSDFIKNGAAPEAARFEVLRAGSDGAYEEAVLEITPVYSISDGKCMIGIYYYADFLPGTSQSVQTVSFSYPDTGYFAATAHSSEAVDTERYIRVLKSAKLSGRDETGLTALPGETIGEIFHDNRFGSFGIWEKARGEALPIAKKSELSLGRATLLSGYGGEGVEEYEVYVTGTYRIDRRDVICLIVTDERIKLSGGVTRGMSGSPLIQNGKIIGALSNTDADGYCAYATFACDMAQELYLLKDIFENGKEALQ